MQRETAETIALNALAWLAGADLLDPFMGTTGAGRDDIATAAGTPEFLAAVLDFVAQDDGWVRDCAAAQGMPPERLMAARAVLPGGDAPHWA